MKKYAIIVAGGSGTRMGSEIPKQFLLLGNKPILIHTLERFVNFPDQITLILVLPKATIADWEEICLQYGFQHPVILAEGGSTRFDSVKSGLSKIQNGQSLVAIHDGVRPLVSEKIIRDSYVRAEAKGSAIASTPLKESIRMAEGDHSISIDREKMSLIQTPQTFRTELIKEAFANFKHDQGFTDDASVAEKYGMSIHLIEGSFQNIKITTPEDLLFAEAIIAQKK